MAVIQVDLTDTFNSWRTKTNQIATNVGDITLLSEYSVPAVDSVVEAINDLDSRTTVATKAISDTDGDTTVQVEETSDDDKIRFDTAGTERMFIDTKVNVADGANTANIDATNNSMNLGVNGTTHLSINNTGVLTGTKVGDTSNLVTTDQTLTGSINETNGKIISFAIALG